MSLRLRDRSGFTLIEVMVAALILVIGAVALATVLIGGQAQASSDVQESQLINVADQEIEQIRADVQKPGGFYSLGLAAAVTPAGSGPGRIRSTWANPDSFVKAGTGVPPTSGCGTNNEYFEIETNYDAGTAANPPGGFNSWQYCGADGEPLQIISGGFVTAPPSSATACGTQYLTDCTVSIGSGTAMVQTYVTDTYIPCDDTNTVTGTTTTSTVSGSNYCATVNQTSGQVVGCGTATSFPSTTAGSTVCADARRVTVAVVPLDDGTTEGRKKLRVTPLYLSSVFASTTPSSGSSAPAGITVGASL